MAELYGSLNCPDYIWIYELLATPLSLFGVRGISR